MPSLATIKQPYCGILRITSYYSTTSSPYIPVSYTHLTLPTILLV